MDADQVREALPERYEVIGGKVYDMSPPPAEPHQRIVGAIYAHLYAFLKGKTCRAYVAPFGVWLDEASGDYVEPDIAVICDPAKIQHKGCVGAPDLVIEILSPSTAVKDKSVKRDLYREKGVREYWLVDPMLQTVEVYRFEGPAGGPMAAPAVYGAADVVPVGALDGVSVDMRDVFET
ncbi:Uma2 family endonuclease [Alicyclobacillus macrosporangiidus]|uniref:Endonuclease, Uma2 family (Restriction endonuclease fold) n=1 Tax=Alicyclobacillus macrosporangiidus TaxID=392015 RepID=A0A1I7L6D6_9BACL|nr:Uma2 family endonuclease [Alicyclobacillus macrosporangiidus]SFV05303.1 Endonuclease, Uma2 family (restriction endonuclease fold) [Alicyclobacillus macrosporangiidus]